MAGAEPGSVIVSALRQEEAYTSRLWMAGTVEVGTDEDPLPERCRVDLDEGSHRE